MSKEYGTIKIPEDAYQRHNEQRKELNLTWKDYIDSQAPERVDVDELLNELSMANDPGVQLDTEGLMREVEKLRELVDRVPERTAEQVEGRLR